MTSNGAPDTLCAANVYRSPGHKVLDYLWVWGNPELSLIQSTNDAHFGAAGPISRAQMLGMHNIYLAGLGVPQDLIYAEALTQPVAHLKRIAWEVSPDAGEGFSFTKKLGCIAELAKQFPQLEGVVIDDMSTVYRDQGFDPDALRKVRDAMPTAPDGWRLRLNGVVYTLSLNDPGVEDLIGPLDVMLLPIWAAEDAAQLDEHVVHAQELGPGKPIIACLYMHNYGGKIPMTEELMASQFGTALSLLKASKVFGIEVTLHGAENPSAVKWLRDWVQEVGDAPLSL